MDFLKKLLKLLLSLFGKSGGDSTAKGGNEAAEPEMPAESGSTPEEKSPVEKAETPKSAPEEPAPAEPQEAAEPQKEKKRPNRTTKFVVFLDNGHVEETPGKRSPDSSLYEWKYNREIVKRIEARLDELGIEHWNTHPEDHWADAEHRTDSKDLILRCQRINAKAAEARGAKKKPFLISVHVNAASDGQWTDATGWSCYTTCGQNNSDKLADCMYQAAEKVLLPLGKKIRKGLSDGDPDEEASFYILKHSDVPCCLTENFFMDCKSDVEWLLSEDGKRAITELHVIGILKWMDINS